MRLQFLPNYAIDIFPRTLRHKCNVVIIARVCAQYAYFHAQFAERFHLGCDICLFVCDQGTQLTQLAMRLDVHVHVHVQCKFRQTLYCTTPSVTAGLHFALLFIDTITVLASLHYKYMYMYTSGVTNSIHVPASELSKTEFAVYRVEFAIYSVTCTPATLVQHVDCWALTEIHGNRKLTLTLLFKTKQLL